METRAKNVTILTYLYIFPAHSAQEFSTVFLNHRAAAPYLVLASIIPDPRLIEKRIYRAAVWQRLRTTGLVWCSEKQRFFTERAFPTGVCNEEVVGFYWYKNCMLITVTARSKAWTVFARSYAGIVGSNPTQGIGCLYCVRLIFVCVVLCVGRGLVTGWSPV
jgi:hypothetical protein